MPYYMGRFLNHNAVLLFRFKLSCIRFVFPGTGLSGGYDTPSRHLIWEGAIIAY